MAGPRIDPAPRRINHGSAMKLLRVVDRIRTNWSLAKVRSNENVWPLKLEIPKSRGTMYSPNTLSFDGPRSTEIRVADALVATAANASAIIVSLYFIWFLSFFWPFKTSIHCAHRSAIT